MLRFLPSQWWRWEIANYKSKAGFDARKCPAVCRGLWCHPKAGWMASSWPTSFQLTVSPGSAASKHEAVVVVIGVQGGRKNRSDLQVCQELVALLRLSVCEMGFPHLLSWAVPGAVRQGRVILKNWELRLKVSSAH